MEAGCIPAVVVCTIFSLSHSVLGISGAVRARTTGASP